MALWGGRFDSTTHEQVTRFTESVSYDKRLYRQDIAGSKAHVTMLAEQGIIPAETAEKIRQELSEVQQQIESGNFIYKIELEDIHMHIEKCLIDALGDEGARVHTARSRNDQVNLDFRLFLREAADDLVRGIRGFQSALVAQAGTHADTILPGFTHLQHAQPVTLGHHLLAYTEMFERDIGRIMDCRKRLNICPLGAGAIAGSTLPVNRETVAELLQFPAVTRNSMDTVADRDFACEFLAALAIFAMHLSRLCEDLILWMSQEFGFIELDDAFCTGSSLMPQKKNPDIAELARGKTGRIYGALVSMLTTCKGLPLTYNRDLQEDKEQVFDAIDTVSAMLAVFPPMIETMKVNKETMFAAASDPYLMATDLAEELVRLSVPFRTAHHRVGSLVKWCRQHGRALDDLTLEEMQITIPEATENCLTLFSPESSVAKRNHTGGTAPEAVREQVAFWTKRLQNAVC